MAKFTYTGPSSSNTIRGVNFPIGEAIGVSDDALALKLSALPYFVQSDAVADPAEHPAKPARGPGRPKKAHTEDDGA